MVKAELLYNPYLLKTTVRFNGEEPRINSLVEKYQSMPLQSWIRKVPEIFYDEMNGYDFELEFSGTKTDFRELVRAFEAAGVAENQVKLFYKNELDDREVKNKKIEDLLKWLAENPNSRFDFTNFWTENRDLYDGSYPFIVFKGPDLDISELDNIDVDVEKVESTEELEHTDLKNTPIIFCIDREELKTLPSDLSYFMNRDDVMLLQMFFSISQNLDNDYVVRTLQDLGVKEPKIVDSLMDDELVRYFKLYPLSDYIYQAIRTFRNTTSKLEYTLDAENRSSARTNRDIYGRIDTLEATIQRLKDTLSGFKNRDYVDIPNSWAAKKLNLVSCISSWRSFKTKITKPEEAQKCATEFAIDIDRFYWNFTTGVAQSKEESKSKLKQTYKFFFEKSGFTDDIDLSKIPMDTLEKQQMPEFSSELLQIKKDTYVQPQKDLFNFFKNSENTNTAPVLQTTYYYQDWRDYVVNRITPLADEVLRKQFELYAEFDKNLAGLYTARLEEHINEYQNRKEQVAASLSSEELKLQKDNDWLIEFKDQLDEIERG